MDALHVIRRMAHNEAWANHRLHTAVAQLDEAAYRLATRTSFFPSIHLTLSHLLHVELFYVDALMDGGAGRAVWAANDRCDRDGTFAEIRAAQAEVDQRLIVWLGERPGADALDAPVRIARRDGDRLEAAGDVLLHLFEHQIHHRGQVHAMLAGTAVPPPQLDEFFLREDLPRREAELRALGLPRA